jgi:hypothetical protein
MKLFHLAAAFWIGCLIASPASAMTMKECGQKYQAAKKAGTLSGKGWTDFRSAECGDAAAATPAAAAPSAAAPAELATAGKADAGPGAAVAAANATFPAAVSSKYASEKPVTARMHTCLDQYRANKANGGNAGLKWIEKGGGYYSQCSKHLRS